MHQFMLINILVFKQTLRQKIRFKFLIFKESGNNFLFFKLTNLCVNKIIQKFL